MSAPSPGAVRPARRFPRLEELFAFAFGTAIAREALWRVPGSVWPVVLAAALGLVVALAVRRSGASRPAPPPVFWCVVALPVLALWALRAPFPDVGYDTLNYHILHGERGLWGPVQAPGDFYPFFFPNQNPTGDLVTAVFRAALGYRGGTLAAALALVWAGEVLWRLLAPAVRDERLRAAAVLLAVTGEGLLWEVSGYMVDLLALPLLLEATALATADASTSKPVLRRTALLGLLLGVAVALKLTNLVFAVPIGLVAIARWLGPRSARPPARTAVAALAAGAAAFVLPVAPHALHVLVETGNPFFPYFNRLFASPYFPPIDVKDTRWGPPSLVEAFAWPLLSALRPGRLSEFAATSGRLAAGWLSAIAALAFFGADRRLRGLAVVVLLGGVLWSLGTGYHRYGLFVELLGGALLVLLAARLAELPPAGGRWTPRRLAALLVLLIAGAQSAAAVAFAVREEWGARPSLLAAPAAWAAEAPLLLRDRDLRAFLPAEARAAIPEDPVWVDAGVKANGIMALLDRDAPMIGLQVEAILEVPQNLRRLDAALAAVRGRPALAIAFREDSERTEASLGRLGFPVRRATPFDLPFFSGRDPVGLTLLEVDLPPPLGVPPADGVTTPWGIDESLLGAMDGPVDGQVVTGELLVRGWARVPGEDLALEIWIGNRQVLPPVLRRVPRPDVSTAFPELGDCSSAGFEALFPRPPGTPEKVTVFVVFRSRSGRMRRYPGATIVWRDAGSGAAAAP